MSEDSINEQVFRFLEGEWIVHRRFEGSYRGSFSGKACFASEADTPSNYLYHEQGELIDGENKRFDAKQSYLYRLTEGKLEVLKQDGSAWEAMHVLEFQKQEGIATASHVHLCGDDHYATVYRVDLSRGWELSYTVNGPKKDYRIHTFYSRGTG
ncbi:DUF6314 family protein [Coraliomargarita sinensis]|uniref:DUF6314 family protein n=1 Tax=Coraliomargarita sinensis TaxID=2174842 RepID=UPI0011B3FE56|nr:DUF6314 family protein [Coraliomargarita sinensis]